MTCQAFEFKHLPMPGGIYEQNPDFLEKVIYIMLEQQKYDKTEEEKKKHAEMGPGGRPRKRMGSRPTY